MTNTTSHNDDDLPFDAELPAPPAARTHCDHGLPVEDQEQCAGCLDDYWAFEASHPDGAAEAELAYERHLESRMDEYGLADLAAHDAAWPNGYAYCQTAGCSLPVFHPGDHDFDPERYERHLRRHEEVPA